MESPAWGLGVGRPGGPGVVRKDGGLVSAILIWALENKIIDGALVSDLEGAF